MQTSPFSLLFFYYRRFCKSTEYHLNIEKQKYRHCGTGTFFQSTDGTGTKKVTQYSIAVLKYRGTAHLSIPVYTISSDGRVVWSVCLLSCRLGFDSELGQTNDFKIGIHSFPA